MYTRSGVEGATVLLGHATDTFTVRRSPCIRTANEFLSFTFSKMGAQLRSNARFAA